ncbi:protein kinase domain-containing protein [Aeromicrobium stalagmiti]|uniref:protein kinase domain-containing protein n=1 Tax=Aeromicrobium stalagmiti TaxID=2738988 RepID=UPI001568446F|nr:protein kinase [Aeromicrobium stalagmiti]NRQ49636.1 protein kinase [Aeromicrobium stalagmiti]
MNDLLNDRYELGEVVGAGGMGAVYRATDVRLGRTVAVKVLRGGPLADETARARMRSEAQLAASIHHPGVAQVFDFAEVSSSHEGMTFIVMQYVEGHSLAQLLRDQGPMAPDQVMSVVVQVAEGLQAAHEAGIVHRDLKPANIMLTPAGRTVLVDFGIARTATSEPLTDTGSLLGTADYMSPEQASGRPATPQSDLYALGVVAHTCLTGESPFRRETPVATALAHLQDDLPVMEVAAPAAVRELIESLTAKDPAARPSTAAVVALQAAAIGAASTIDLPPTFELPAVAHPQPTGVMTSVPPTGVMTSAPATAPVPGPAGSRRRPLLLVAAAAATLIVGLVGVNAVGSEDELVMPDVVGMSIDDASAQLRDAGMTARPRTVDVAGHRSGDVVKQTPAAGSIPSDAGTVRVLVASGKVRVSADDVVGTTYAKAAAALEKLGFQVRRDDVAQQADAGQVVALDRSGRLPDGSTITLSVAVAPAAESSGSTSTSGSGSSTSTGKGKSKGKSKGKGGK